MASPNQQITDRLVEAVERFKPFHDGRDRVWRFFLKIGRQWIELDVRWFDGNYYWNSSERVSLEISDDHRGRQVDEWILEGWLAALDSWYEEVSRDPFSAQLSLFRRLPLQHRLGLILRSNVRKLLPEWCDFSSELQGVALSDLESLLERRPPEPLPEMTLARYLEYCRVAYEANPQTFERQGFTPGQSGMEYYRSYADGRHGGLLDIDPHSPEAFAAWYHSGQSAGSHPWEIYRGGNATHISLAVVRDQYQEGWRVLLSAFSSTRLAEACRIALALDRAGLPVEITDRESYLLRLRDEDWVGILPEEYSLRYGWHNFSSDYKVADCVYLYWFFEEKGAREKALMRRRLRHLVQWMPLRFSWETRKNSCAGARHRV